jgi:two-component system, OmpR family, sensor kinase
MTLPWPRTLRWRVAAASAASIFLATALLGIAAYHLVARELDQSREQALRDGAVQVARLDASAPGLLTTPGALEGRLGGRRLLVEVVDRRRRIVVRSETLGGQVLDVQPALAQVIRTGRARWLDTRLGADRLRAYVAPLTTLGAGPAAGGAVVVATSTADDRETLRRLRGLVGAAAILAGLVAALAALALTRRALRPLSLLSAAAADIERTGDAARRLPDTRSRDELAALGETLNAMLGSLQRAGERERRFLADASHELRTPVTALRGNAAYVARHGADAAVLQDLEHDAERLARLLDDLLALAREDAAAPPAEVVDLAELARATAGARVQVDAPTRVRVRGDAAALGRALANLVENAERYGPPDGEIIVSARREGRMAVLEVRDEGPGIAPEDAAHAFDRFWRGPAADRPPGTGLGLAIVRATAERHDGTATADGAVFRIELPALSETSQGGGVDIGA